MISKQLLIIKALKKSNQPVLIITGEHLSLDLLLKELDITSQSILAFDPNSGVEELREITKELIKTPLRGGRLFILDRCEKLNREQINTLLKILEEPPDHLKIILYSNSLSRVLKTVRSRCKVFVVGFDKNHDREISIISLLELPFIQFTQEINSMEKEQFLAMIEGGLEECKKTLLNKDDFDLLRYLAKAYSAVNATNANYKMIAENLYIRNKANK